ncbi:hypothetical protein [Zhengella mangrovi]|uniref:hypothetical protein n=1 Tax=Zhengella mangrovi TaxID=1982044 RepID=UPI00197B447F|nr:hypothetical protein [Zhengella mangrovi]
MDRSTRVSVVHNQIETCNAIVFCRERENLIAPDILRGKSGFASQQGASTVVQVDCERMNAITGTRDPVVIIDENKFVDPVKNADERIPDTVSLIVVHRGRPPIYGSDIEARKATIPPGRSLVCVPQVS